MSGGANAFTTPKTAASISSSGSRSPVFLAATGHDDNNENNEMQPNEDFFNPIITEFARPLFTAATSAFLATSLLFSNPLLPPPDAQAAPPPQPSSQTATSIDIDLRSVPALTRKAIVNRDALTNYLIESIKSFKPILDLLSESDTVTVKPPKDVKGAINQALTRGDAKFVVNGEAVDVRVESVPGVIVVRVINPNIPRLPFLKDGTAALKFVDEIVDEAPEQLEKAAEEVEAIEKFLMWGAPRKAPIQYSGSTLDYFLSSKFVWNGETVSLGALGDLTNSEVVVLGVGAGVAGAYSASYGYYVSLREEADREAAEKKAKIAAKKKKAKAATDAKAKKVEKPTAAKPKKETTEAQKVDPPPAPKEPTKAAAEESSSAKVSGATSKEDAPETPATTDDTESKGRKRDVFKKLFRRGKE